MSDDFEPFATSGSGKSEAEVAFDLLNKLKGQGIWGERNKSDILDMFAECLDAVKGYRVYEGQNRLIAPVRELPVQKTVTEQAGAPRAQASQTQGQAQGQIQGHAPAPVPVQPARQAQANPVQTQQHQLQQQIHRQG